jgi:ElaB/YqjD/DUF883 family membrane-anchored ribosome-binding protein
VPALAVKGFDRLRRGWDELGAGAAGRAWRPAWAAAGGIGQEVAHRASEGATVLAGGIEARPPTSVAVALLFGLAVGALLRRRR